MISRFESITSSNIKAFCDRLAEMDTRVEKMLASFGYPVFRERKPLFDGLVRIILEQQVSISSALAVFARLEKRLEVISPEGILSLSDEDFKSAGFSRQKIRYVRILSHEVLHNGLDLSALESLPDEAVRKRLCAITGIGPWTCDVFLIFCLKRCDIFPAGDLALKSALAENAFVTPGASREQCLEVARRFKPLRSVFSILLWHAYIVRHRIKAV